MKSYLIPFEICYDTLLFIYPIAKSGVILPSSRALLDYYEKAVIQTIYLPQKIISPNLSKDVRPIKEINIHDIWKNDTLTKQPTRNTIFLLKTVHLASAELFSSVNNHRISRFTPAEIGCPLKAFFEKINFFTDHCTGYSCSLM